MREDFAALTTNLVVEVFFSAGASAACSSSDFSAVASAVPCGSCINVVNAIPVINPAPLLCRFINPGATINPCGKEPPS
jgi:hypothetical protein